MPHESENLILLCWVQIWAMSFWYQEKSEKELRFQQLLVVLKKVVFFDSKTINLLFDSVENAEENNMMIRLYEFFLINKIKLSHVTTDKFLRYLDNNKIKKKENVKYIFNNIGIAY